MLTQDSSIRVFLVDDHELLIRGLYTYLEGVQGVEVCGVADNGPHALEEIIRLGPNIVITDVNLPGFDGLALTRQIKQALPLCEVIIFSGLPESDDLIRLIFESGAKCFLHKADIASLLIEALECVSEHRPFFTKNVSDIVLASLVHTPSGMDHRLSAEEQALVWLLAHGHSNKSAAKLKGLSERTIENMRAGIMRKLQITSFAELVHYAVRNDLAGHEGSL